MSNPIYQAVANAVVLNTADSIENLITSNTVYGTIIRQVVIQANQDITAGIVRFYIKTDGVNWRLFREVTVPEVKRTNQYPAYSTVLYFNNIVLPQNASLGVDIVNSEEFIITGFGLEITSYS